MEVQRHRVIQAVARALVAVLGAVALVALAPAVSTAAPAYPNHHCNVTIDPPSGQVKAGGTFSVTGTYYISTKWTVSFNGVTRKFTGPTFTTTFQVPRTARTETLTLKVSCSNGDVSRFRIEILGSGINSGSGHLPNTGGPSIWWLIFAALAGATGSFLMWRGRRRHAVVTAAAPPGKHSLRS